MHEGCAARERGGGRGWSDEPGPVTNAIGREGFVNVLKGEPGSSGPASLCCSQGRRQPARQHTPPRGSRLARRSSAVPPPSSAHSSRSTQAHLPRCLCCQLGAEARVLTAAQADTRPPPAPHVRLCPDRAAPRCDPGSQPAGQHRHRPHDPDGYVPLILLDFVK